MKRKQFLDTAVDTIENHLLDHNISDDYTIYWKVNKKKHPIIKIEDPHDRTKKYDLNTEYERIRNGEISNEERLEMFEVIAHRVVEEDILHERPIHQSSVMVNDHEPTLTLCFDEPEDLEPTDVFISANHHMNPLNFNVVLHYTDNVNFDQLQDFQIAETIQSIVNHSTLQFDELPTSKEFKVSLPVQNQDLSSLLSAEFLNFVQENYSNNHCCVLPIDTKQALIVPADRYPAAVLQEMMNIVQDHNIWSDAYFFDYQVTNHIPSINAVYVDLPTLDHEK